MANEKHVNEEIQEEVVIPEEMKLEEGEVLRIRVINYNPETGDYEIQINGNGKKIHIMQALAEICNHFDMACIPKEVLKMGIIMSEVEKIALLLNEEKNDETDESSE